MLSSCHSTWPESPGMSETPRCVPTLGACFFAALDVRPRAAPSIGPGHELKQHKDNSLETIS